MQYMNWDHLKVFLAVARTGTALAASRELGVNHSTIIRRIDQLEADLSTKLFDRLQSGYQLSKEGRHVLAAAEQMETGALQLSRELRGQQQLPAGTLRLSLPEVALFDLSDLLQAFVQAHPQIDLLIQSSADASNLARMEADVAIRLTDTPPELLVGRQLGRVEFGVYGQQDYVDSLGAPSNTQAYSWLLWRGSHQSDIPEVQHPDVLLAEAIAPASVVMRSNSMEDVLAWVRAGSGVGLMAKQWGEREEALTQLPFQKILERLAVASVGLWLLTHKDMKQSARVRAFMDFTVEYLASRNLNA